MGCIGGQEAINWAATHDPMASDPLPPEAWPDMETHDGLVRAGIFYKVDDDEDE